MAEHSRLEPFLILARSTKGAAAAKVVLDATAANGVFAFGELMEVPNVKELSNDSNYQKQVQLLNLFAYGTLKEYLNAPESYPPLTPAHKTKLKQLTLVSMALAHRSLSYADLSAALDVSSTRELENLIIDTIYAGLLRAKMHQNEQTLHVDWVSGRDVAPEDIPRVKATLETWCQNTATLLSALDEQIAAVRKQAADEATRDATYQRNLDSAFLHAKKDVENKNRNTRGSKHHDEALGEQRPAKGEDTESADWQQAISASLAGELSEGILGGEERRGSRTTDARSVESIDEPRKKKAKD